MKEKTYAVINIRPGTYPSDALSSSGFGQRLRALSIYLIPRSLSESGLTGDALIYAVNSFSGFYAVSTVNPDSSPNIAFFIFSAFEHEGKLYLRLNLDENQSKHNILSTKLGVAMCGVTPGTMPGDKPFAVSGARMRFRLVEDKDLIIEMSNGRNSPSLFVEVLQVRPLG